VPFQSKAKYNAETVIDGVDGEGNANPARPHFWD